MPTPETFDQEISADLLGKKRQGNGKGGKWRRKEGKLEKGRWKIENEGRSWEMSFVLFCFFTFEND